VLVWFLGLVSAGPAAVAGCHGREVHLTGPEAVLHRPAARLTPPGCLIAVDLGPPATRSHHDHEAHSPPPGHTGATETGVTVVTPDWDDFMIRPGSGPGPATPRTAVITWSGPAWLGVGTELGVETELGVGTELGVRTEFGVRTEVTGGRVGQPGSYLEPVGGRAGPPTAGAGLVALGASAGVGVAGRVLGGLAYPSCHGTQPCCCPSRSAGKTAETGRGRAGES
jgi:hypothetical protein